MSTEAFSATTSTHVDLEEYHRVQMFLFREARLADESSYAEWEALWDADGVYWIPVGDGNYDPNEEVSIIHDNRARIASRIKQLESGKRYAQVPVSVMRRSISNLEVSRTGPDTVLAEANFLMLEMALQSTREVRLWGGRVQYALRTHGDMLRIYRKKVTLVNGSEPIPNLPFLI